MKFKPHTMMAKVYDQVKDMETGDSIIADKNHHPDGTEQTWESFRMCLSKVAARLDTFYWTRLGGNSLTIVRVK